MRPSWRKRRRDSPAAVFCFMTQQIDAEEVTEVVRELVEGVQRVLGRHFVGAYVTGSLTTGEFDEASDIDVVIVTEGELPDDKFDALETMHDDLARQDRKGV